MGRLQLIVIVGFVLTFSAWAKPPAADAGPVPGTSAAAPPLPEIQQRMTRSQTEVKRLEHEVARQESDSDRASQRLQEQDRQIAELRRKLSQLQPAPAAEHP